MSNQFGLMLSFIFLAYIIIFSGELVAYQEKNAIFISNVNQIAHHLQVYGYDIDYISSAKEKYTMKEVIVIVDDDYLKLECKKDYEAFTQLCKFLDGEFTCSLYIY